MTAEYLQSYLRFSIYQYNYFYLCIDKINKG